MGIEMNDQSNSIDNHDQIRQALRDLIAEIAQDLAKRAGMPSALLDIATDLEAAALDLRTRFRRHAGK